jgi:hypothetical protein
MACITAITSLKRGHDLENYGSGHYECSPKRRRCSNLNLPAGGSPKSPTSYEQTADSSVGSGRCGFGNPDSSFPQIEPIDGDEILTEVTARYKGLKRRRLVPKPDTSPPRRIGSPGLVHNSDSDNDSNCGMSTKQRLQEIQKLFNETQLNGSNSPKYSQPAALPATSMPPQKPSTPPQSTQGAPRCASPEAPKKYNPDTAIRLTLRSVAMICDSLLKTREDQIREEYDKILQQKLSEQYEMFCRFSRDQLRQHKPTSSSSYIS